MKRIHVNSFAFKFSKQRFLEELIQHFNSIKLLKLKINREKFLLTKLTRAKEDIFFSSGEKEQEDLNRKILAI